MKRTVAFVLLSALAVLPAAALARSEPMVGGQAMYPSKDIVDNAVNSTGHPTLVAAVKAAGLVDTLKSQGPFTVFAPTNAAFSAIPAGTVDTLLKPENKAGLTKVLTYHVVPGKMDAAALQKAIKAGNGTATLRTASGGVLWGDDERRPQHRAPRREGRDGQHLDVRLLPVQRRDPRDRPRGAPQLA